MRNQPLILLSACVVVALTLMGLAALAYLPDRVAIPLRWNEAGGAERIVDSWYAVLMPVVIGAGSSVLFAILPRIEPLQSRLRDSAPLLEACWMATLALITLVQAMIVSRAFDIALPIALPMAGFGIVLVAIGNALPKSRPGFFIGIRTPWALADTDNWIATHRLGSRTVMVAGLMIFLAAGLPIEPEARSIISGLALACAFVPPFAYSYWFWRRQARG